MSRDVVRTMRHRDNLGLRGDLHRPGNQAQGNAEADFSLPDSS
ncbi:hypothetical protein XHC_3967 [Xanthomonas hortorum pv. carotae str. M081]|nr:hypothetical protein XHC_3967 [Xanthomonas hortorum pv. carotae str. M081]